MVKVLAALRLATDLKLPSAQMMRRLRIDAPKRRAA
jgi:hypothetical protein